MIYEKHVYPDGGLIINTVRNYGCPANYIVSSYDEYLGNQLKRHYSILCLGCLEKHLLVESAIYSEHPRYIYLEIKE